MYIHVKSCVVSFDLEVRYFQYRLFKKLRYRNSIVRYQCIDISDISYSVIKFGHD